MNEVFKAIDSLDNTECLFHFDNNGGETVHFIEGWGENFLIERFKRTGCDFEESADTRSRMINPVLVATW